MTFTAFASFSQSAAPYVRIAKIRIDSSSTGSYNEALRIHAEAAVKNEPGVLTLYAVHEQDRPTEVTVFEIYRDEAAYKSHITTPHFLTYKAAVKNMVKALVITDQVPIALQSKFSSH